MAKLPPPEYPEIAQGTVKTAVAAAKATQSKEMFDVPVNQIHVLEDFNIRVATPERKAHLAELQALIAANGFRRSKPLEVMVLEDGSICVTDGHARLEAVQAHNDANPKNKITTLPCVFVPPGSTTADILDTFVVSNSGTRLSPLELGIVLARQVQFGRKEVDLAKRYGISTKYVRDLLTLVSAPSEVRNLVVAGKVSAGTAMDAIREHGPSEAGTVLKQAVSLAAEAGKTKATGRHARTASEAKPAAGNKAKPETLRFRFKAGKFVKLAAIEGVSQVPGGWYELGTKEDEVQILRNTVITVKLGPAVKTLAEEV